MGCGHVPEFHFYEVKIKVLNIYFMIVCGYVCVRVLYTGVEITRVRRKIILISLELELQKAVGQLVWIPGTEL